MPIAARAMFPHRQCGKLVVASDPDEVAYLEKLLKQAAANGVDDCLPHRCRGTACTRAADYRPCGAVSPSTGIIDSHGLMDAYITDIEAHGGTIVVNSPLLSGELTANGLNLSVGGNDPFHRERTAGC